MALWDILWAYVLAFLLAATPFVEAVVVIPLGVIVGLHLIPVTILALAGNIITVLLVILFINQIKAWWERRRQKKGEQQESKRFVRARKFWNRYGLPGLALIGPAVVGSHLTAFMSLTLGGTKVRTSYWMVGSLTAWCLLTAIFTYFGVDFMNIPTGEDSWLGKLLSPES